MNREAWQRPGAAGRPGLELDAAGRAALPRDLRARDAEPRRELEAFLATEAGSRGFLDRAPSSGSAALLRAIGEEDAPGTRAAEGEGVGPYRVRARAGPRRHGRRVPGRARRRPVRAARGAEAGQAGDGQRGDPASASAPSGRSWPASSTRTSRACWTAASARTGSPYFAMEHVEGEPLTDVLRPAGRLDRGAGCACSSRSATRSSTRTATWSCTATSSPRTSW